LGVAAVVHAQDVATATPTGAGAAPGKTPASALLGGLTLTSQSEPISVTADSLEFDYRSRILTYTGHVQVIQADLKLESHTLRVVLDDKAQADAQIKEVVAAGNVHMQKGTRWATAGRAVFDQAKRTVTLQENAVLHDNTNEISGDRVVVYLDEERSVVEGGHGRVKAVLYPNRDEEKKDGP